MSADQAVDREVRRAGGSDSQDQIDDLSAAVARNRADIDALQVATRDVAELIAQLRVGEGSADEQVAHLEEALRSSRRIGAAVGILMAERGINEAAAFAILSRASQDTNLKLRLVADEIVLAGGASHLPHE